MYDSIARNNIVYDEAKAIFISRSPSNQVYNNTISNSGETININSGSTNNKMYDNMLMNSKSYAILINNSSNGNTFYSNKIVSNNKEGLEIVQDATSKNNVFSNNEMVNSVPNNTITNPTHEKTKSEISGKGE
jgi:parallel beta-helix repeat protein